MNNWFSGFLESLFARCGANNPIWITAKQAQVCSGNMDNFTRMVEMPGGYNARHNFSECEWNGRKVLVSHSKLNGCAQITFGSTAEESAAWKVKEDERKLAELKTHPRRLARAIENTKELIDNCQFEIRDNTDNPDENSPKEILFYQSRLKEFTERLNALQG